MGNCFKKDEPENNQEASKDRVLETYPSSNEADINDTVHTPVEPEVSQTWQQ